MGEVLNVVAVFTPGHSGPGSDQFHPADNYAGPQPLGWLLRDYAAGWRSYRKVKTPADRTGARLVFGHDADVLAELRREEFYD